MRQKADAFFSLEGAVLAGDDPEAIHDMRVASRRLQEILRLVFSDDPHLEELIRVVRRARRVQSPVRDRDVMAERLRKTAKEAADADARAALLFLQKEVVIRRRRGHRKMAEALGALDLSGRTSKG
jgi:CHAD domain-containing protein